jgi:hypothetical protein
MQSIAKNDMVNIQDVRVQDDLSSNATQYLDYHIYRGIFFMLLQTYFNLIKNKHLSQAILSKIHIINLFFSNLIVLYALFWIQLKDVFRF